MQRKLRKYKKMKMELSSNLTNDIPVRLSSLSHFVRRNRTRLSRQTISYSKITSLAYPSSYLIPLICILVLLALLMTLVNPNSGFSSGNVYADNSNSNSSNNNSNVALLADNGNEVPSATLSYSKSLDMSSTGTITEGKTNTVITMTNNVTVDAKLINNYSLQIYSNSTSTILDGPTTINPIDNTTNPSSFTGLSADSMLDNTWGYSWGNDNDSSKLYKGITTTPVTIDNTGINSTTGSVYYTKPLTFAAKFSKEAIAGHYKANVILSLAAAPKALITYTLSYNNNGGGTVPSTQTISSYSNSQSFTIPNATSTVPIRSGYEFAGYATTSNGSVAYQPGSTITLPTSTSTTNNTTNTVTQVLYAKWNQVYNYSVTYNANNGTGTVPTTQTASSTNATYSFTAAVQGNLTRTGYTFLGWSESPTATTATYTAGSSTISLSSTEQSKTLYAVWKYNVTWSNMTTMQQMTPEICASASTNASKTLTDDREYPDGVIKTYTIQKFADGKCWMTQNLRITGTGSDDQITADNSNGTPVTGWKLPVSSVVGFSDNTASNAYLGYDNKGISTGFYTWCTATAGTCSSAMTEGATVSVSICPKGWRLPGAYSNKKYGNEFRDLFLKMDLTISNSSLASAAGAGTRWGTTSNLTKTQGSPYNFDYTGYVYNSYFYSGSSSKLGLWWSDVAHDSTFAYRLLINESDVYPGTNGNGVRLYGCAVRCVAE